MEYFFSLYGSVIIKLLLAVLLGSFIGIERTYAGKEAGMRTYALVSMGSCLFVLVGELVRQQLGITAGLDPLRMASQIIPGIGFIGAGMIIFQGNSVHGLTTAAGLWVAAGLGMAIGFGLYVPALLAGLFTVFVLSIMWWAEKIVSPGIVPEKKNKDKE